MCRDKKPSPKSHESKPQDYGPKSLWRIKKEHLTQVLDLCGHDVQEAAPILDISTEDLLHLMKKLEIPERNACSESERRHRLRLEPEAGEQEERQ